MTRTLNAVSLQRLNTCDPALRAIVSLVASSGPFDQLLVIEGLRTLEQQRQYVAKGLSKTMESKHLPDAYGRSRAIDIGIINQDGSVNWGKTEQERRACYVLAGAMYTVARQLGYEIRFGGNWDSDSDYTDQTWLDLFHFELVP